MENSKSQKARKLNDEIDVLDIIKPIWIKRWFVLKITLLFAIIGIVTSLLSKNEYTTNVAFIPQSSGETGGGLGGQLGGLADLAGFELGGESKNDEFPPSLYPILLENINFQKNVLESKLYLDGWEDSISYSKYYLEVYKPSVLYTIKSFTLDLPLRIIDAVKGKTVEVVDSNEKGHYFIKLTRDDERLMQTFFSQVSINPDQKRGYVTVSMSMPDPMLAAQMADNVQKLIHTYIVDYKTQKALQELKYIQDNFDEKKKEFQKAQEALSSFLDSNLSLSTVSAKNQLRLLENEFDLVTQVYNNLAAKLEEAKLNLSKKTPLLTIIKPVTVPIRKSGPRVVFNTGIGFVIGLILSIFLVFIPIIKESVGRTLNEKL